MRRQWILILLVAAACCSLALALTRCGSAAEGTSIISAAPPRQEAPDSLVEAKVLMARAEVFATLERPAVVFDHKKHTDALSKEGCNGCHPADEQGKVSYQYIDWRPLTGKQRLRDAYHEKCNTCHYEGATQAGAKVRALGCGECHMEEAQHPPEWYQPSFEHFPHIDSMEKGCDTCHHQYDDRRKKLVYVKGQEEACGKCHKDTSEQNRETLRKVGHSSCIGCHEKEYKEAKIKFDPHSCDGCHRPEAKKPLPEPREIVARAYQARPKQLFISYPGAILPAVPFDHEKHDPRQQCSKSCHNYHVKTLVSMDMRFTETASSCEECHKKANINIRPACLQADKIYHDKESATSCIGCHIQENKKATKKEESPITCRGCHKGEAGASIKIAAAEPADTDKGPEMSIIARASNKYLPVKFPHQQHTKMIDDCNSCHHHGPEKQKPACFTCHGEPMDFMKLTKPRLISAYHRMCMGCHRSMGSGPITCNKCHEERDTIIPSDVRLQVTQTTKRPEAGG